MDIKKARDLLQKTITNPGWYPAKVTKDELQAAGMQVREDYLLETIVEAPQIEETGQTEQQEEQGCQCNRALPSVAMKLLERELSIEQLAKDDRERLAAIHGEFNKKPGELCERHRKSLSTLLTMLEKGSKCQMPIETSRYRRKNNKMRAVLVGKQRAKSTKKAKGTKRIKLIDMRQHENNVTCVKPQSEVIQTDIMRDGADDLVNHIR
ncbi:hypothetical protein PVAR5_6258 [Paecilomyces variotii No. 5]|uniref:Uncharacterized protein n=1 Tax=Byssochlamys spectabilis (strain No. 5 / NBRC 109023) TaxID=1356009 RepID=V5I3B8_BYSSN|nr:hypothetical protein PVAR5_6258 [Paecilomyces variotii No. 5]